MEENCIRRERIRKIQKKKLIEEMRAALPVYNLEEIRHYRLPFYEALLIDLDEKNYTFTSKYIAQLCQYQVDFKQKEPVSQVWAGPYLIDSKAELKMLVDHLTKTEDFHRAGNFTLECREFLQIAVYFAFSDQVWWWLGEKLLIHTVEICLEYAGFEGQYEALTRYAYAKFLVEKFKSYDPAMDHLIIARRLSNGKEWMTKVIFPEDVDILFLKVNYLMYVCLIREVETLMQTDYIQASKFADLARKRASEACYPEGVITALMLKGMCQLSSNDTKGAISTFTQAYYKQVTLGSEMGICESRIHIAEAYLLDGKTHLSLNTLLLLRESAEQYQLPYYLAQAYKHLGEFFLTSGEATKSIPLLMEALHIFYQSNNMKESEQVRSLEAIAVGLDLFPKYAALLDKTNSWNYLEKLIDWKDSRKLFLEEDTSSGKHSVAEILQESKEELERRNGSYRSKSADVLEDGTASSEWHGYARAVIIADTPEIINRIPSINTEEIIR